MNVQGSISTSQRFYVSGSISELPTGCVSHSTFNCHEKLRNMVKYQCTICTKVSCQKATISVWEYLVVGHTLQLQNPSESVPHYCSHSQVYTGTQRSSISCRDKHRQKCRRVIQQYIQNYIGYFFLKLSAMCVFKLNHVLYCSEFR
jgi:hypothetical protein